MNWLGYAILSAIANAVGVISIKVSSGRIHSGLGGSVLNFVAFLLTGIYTLINKAQGAPVLISAKGITFSIVAGLSYGIGVTCFYAMLGSGTNVSIGAPIVQIGNILLASALGILFLKEPISVRYLAGAAIALIGLYLLATSH